MRLFWMSLAMLLAGMTGHAGECAVTVVLSSSVPVSAAELVEAQKVAGGIYGGIGVALHWGGKPDTDTCETRIAIRLEKAGSPEVSPNSLAYATVGSDAEHQIHVFIDRVNAVVGRPSGPVLGHVLAHEVAHILEGVPRHSASGILKAHWEPRDIQDLLWRPLRFELVDEALIHAALAKIHHGDPPKSGD
jgi:hypothetical protein